MGFLVILNMFSNFIQFLFILIAYSPTILIVGLVDIYNCVNEGNTIIFISSWKDLFNRINLIFLFFIFLLLCYIIIKIASKKLTIRKIEVDSIDSVDFHLFPFLFSYFLPCIELIKKDLIYIIIWIVLLVIIMFVSKDTHFYNPILKVFGYRYYKINTKAKISYTIITKNQLKNAKSITSYSQLTDYVILDQT